MILKFFKIIIPFILVNSLISCESSSGESTQSAGGLSGFHLVNSPAASTNRLDILYNREYSGTISYIVSLTDLGITSQDEFNISTAAKTNLSIAADTSDGPVYDDYIAVRGCTSDTPYFVYIMDNASGEVRALTQKTKASGSRVQETGIITGYADDEYPDGYPIEYTISFPAAYNTSSSTLWPLLIAFKGGGTSDPNFPCIILSTDTRNTGFFEQVVYDIDRVRDKIKDIIENSSFRIDRSRVYACGFSLGGCAVLRIANNDSSTLFNVAAIVANGASYWLPDVEGWVENLGNTNYWICGGENDSYRPEDCYSGMPKNSGDHYLTLYPGIAHTSSPTWDSPYTYIWLLSKQVY